MHRNSRAALPVKWAALLLTAAACPAWADMNGAGDLADLSLEELANIPVTSVSKRAEPLADAAASIFVITGEDIRRSGATTLPEALRLAPNLEVARVDARNYAITARGFNSPFENKMLVLIDGRTVYSPLFSGVFWDVQDVVLEDVERIEVISGPGATLWGANAVNGVINIITRSAAETQGTLVTAGAGGGARDGAVRYGGTLPNGGHYRVYGKLADNTDTDTVRGTSSDTGWRRSQTGFRADTGDAVQHTTLQGDAYSGRLHQAGTDDIHVAGANLTGHLTRRMSERSSLDVLAYWDYTERLQPLAYNDHLHTLSVEAQDSVQLTPTHNVVVGGGYRAALDHVQSAQAFAFLPDSLNMHWGNVFVQDEMELVRDLRLTTGAKLEHNNYTGWEFLPTVRLAWKPTAGSLLWSAVSRAVRTPSRIDRDFYSPTTPRVVNGVPQYAIAGGPEFESEVANVLEVGYRVQPASTLSFSATAFGSRYEDLRTVEPNPDGPGVVFMNGAEGRTHGLEMWGSWQPAHAWRLSAGGVVQRISTSLKPGNTDLTGTTGLATNDPTHYWMLRSSYDITERQELDLTLREVGALATANVPAYTSLDARYGWKIRPGLELSVIGQNLLDHSHAEYGTPPARNQFDRSLFLKLVWRP